MINFSISSRCIVHIGLYLSPDLKDVEPPEGRLEFLAYLVNEEQQNQSVQVKKKIPPLIPFTENKIFFRLFKRFIVANMSNAYRM